MKKISLLLSIIMCAFVGIFFACNEDRYADLNISVNSVVTVASNNAVKYNAEENCYEVVYGESFTIDASVFCSSDISKSLIFDSINTSAINVIGNPRNTENGAIATFEAKAPSYDSVYTVKISSVETIRNSVVINIKVVLPINEIQISNNLGLSANNELSLKNYTEFRTDIVSPYETNEKGIIYVLKSFKANNQEEISLHSEDGVFTYNTTSLNGKYYGQTLEDGSFSKMFFVSNEGGLFLVDNSLQGKIKVEAKSTKYSEEIASLITREEPLTEQEQNLYNQNERLIDDSEVTIIKELTLQDISFVGGQVGFDIEGETTSVKLDSTLYLNSIASYMVGSTKHYYNYEQVDLIVNTPSQIKVETEIGSLVIGGEEQQSNNNVLDITSSDNMIIIPIVSQGVVTGYKTNIKFKANGGSGKNYVDLIISYSEFDNNLSYRFSELYSNYLETLTDEQISNFGIDKEITKLVFDASALPVNISLLQDGNSVDALSTTTNPLKVFDVYAENSSLSTYGSKIAMNLTLSNGIASEKINNENKVVRVYISHSDSGININDYLEIRDSRFNKINFNLSNGKYVYDFDLSNYSTSYFFIKANKNNLSSNAQFTIEFENLLFVRTLYYCYCFVLQLKHLRVK